MLRPLLRHPGIHGLSAMLAGGVLVGSLLIGEARTEEPAEAARTDTAIDAAEVAPVVAGIPAEKEAPTPAGVGLGHMSELLARARWDAEKGSYRAALDDGREATLTLDHELQHKLERLLRSYAVPGGAVVAMDPATGRLLAVAEYAHEEASRGLALEASYPAASVFKVVTAAALLEAGVPPDEEVCYHGGLRRIDRRHLKDDPRRDNACATLSDAMGRSVNVVFAKLAGRMLDVDSLSAMAGRFLFNQPLPMLPAPPHVDQALVSPALIPEEELEFGRTAAGFGEVYLSPLHGAMLAAAVGNGGLLVEPTLVASIDSPAGPVAPTPRRQRLVSEETAAELTRMLERTVTRGTARQAFLERRRPALGGVSAAGKTGSLFAHKPFRDYSWFVGFAPAENPTIAVAAVMVNGLKWRVKAPYVAREAMRLHLVHEKARQRQAANDAPGNRG